MNFTEQSTLGEATGYLEKKKKDGEGVACPACGQHVQVYAYRLFATSARALIDLYKLTETSGKEYHHVTEWAEARRGLKRAPHFAEMRFWGLIEPLDRKTREENSQGFWKITDAGKRFASGRSLVQERIHIFNNTLVGFSGKDIDVRNALGNKFNYSEIMLEGGGFEVDESGQARLL